MCDETRIVIGNQELHDLSVFATQVRKDVASMTNKTRDSHIGGGYSSIDIMTVLYKCFLDLSPQHLDDPGRNIFILSKGHIAASMYAVLARMGILPVSALSAHLQDGGNLPGHIRRHVTPGVEMSSGSLGHGPGVAAGMAYAKRIKHLPGKVYVLMGDGECNEGSVWEAVMLAVRHQLSNLILIVDRNRLQSYGSDQDVLNLGDLSSKFQSFGCRTDEIDGHDFRQITRALEQAGDNASDVPTVIIANTIKGKGVSYMENRLEWHFKSPDDAQLEAALRELES